MQMTGSEKPPPRNSNYIFEEGHSGGGPDNGSSVSSSSHGSSMKFITAKLKPQGRTRLLVLAVIVAVVVVVVAAIATAVYFTNGNEAVTGEPLRQVDGDKGGVSTVISSTSTSVPSTNASASSTIAPPSNTGVDTTTSSMTSLPTTTESPSTETTSARPETTTTPFVDNTEPSNASVVLSDIYYSPDDVKTLTLKCQGRHSGDWNSLTLRRQFKDSYEPIAVVTKDDNGTAAVIVFYPNVTHSLILRNYELTLIVTIDPFKCEQLTNFTCAMDTEEGIVSAGANISVFMPGIQMKLPHSVVEDLVITLQCTVDVFEETNATILWKFKPRGSDQFLDFSVSPVTEVIQKTPCAYYINSTLTFTPTMYENGSDFRCEVVAPWWSPSIVQEKSTGAQLRVLPKSFCDEKRQFSIHPHPDGPCTRVIYCLNTGPLVYAIECEPGYCYDTTKTTCILQEES